MSTSEILKLAEERIYLIMEVNRLRAALQRIKFMNIKPDQKCCEDAVAIAREALQQAAPRCNASWRQPDA
jgi:hypothetical protein